MIIFFIFTVYSYRINAGSMIIINRDTRIYNDSVRIVTGKYSIFADSAKETPDTLFIRGDVSIKKDSTELRSDFVNYVLRTKTFIAGSPVNITEGSNLIHGDKLFYISPVDSGIMQGNFLFQSESLLIFGDYAYLKGKDVKILGNPEFRGDSFDISADTITVFTQDSSILFQKCVRIKRKEVKGKAEKIMYFKNQKIARVYTNPLFFSDRDTVLGDSGCVYMSENRAVMYNGKSISHTKDGVNETYADSVIFFFESGKIDSIEFIGKTKGVFVKNGTEG